MAKRIIKVGKYNKLTCTACECEFSFDDNDKIPTGQEGAGKVTCPQCGAVLTPATKPAN
jgi:PHP family Zn ribbon phosphoesterase